MFSCDVSPSQKHTKNISFPQIRQASPSIIKILTSFLFVYLLVVSQFHRIVTVGSRGTMPSLTLAAH
jgi:hypothetical protein